MADTRSSTAGAVSSSDFATAAQFNSVAGGIIGKKFVTSNVSNITAVQDVTGGSLTLTPNSSRVIRIDYSMVVTSNTTGDNYQVLIVKDGATFDRKNFAISAVDFTSTATSFAIDVAPTAASHTYKLQVGRSGTSSGSLTVQANGTQMCSLVISDEGPSF